MASEQLCLKTALRSIPPASGLSELEIIANVRDRYWLVTHRASRMANPRCGPRRITLVATLTDGDPDQIEDVLAAPSILQNVIAVPVQVVR